MKKYFEALEPALAYWRNLSARERTILSVGGIIVALLLFYGMAWAPIQKSLVQLRKQVPEEYSQLQWMRNQVERVKQLRASAPATQNGGSLLSVVERSSQALDLQKYVK